jgi:hypothetical protein
MGIDQTVLHTAGTCQSATGVPQNGTAYEDIFPYYAEICALSELRKKPGFGAPIFSGMGGHALLYLNGVRLDRGEDYPVLRLCDADEPPAHHGAGVSVNSHYSNANWVAVEGRDFLWRGALAPGEQVTREGYERTQDMAKAKGCFEGISFHRELFEAKPPGMSDHDYMYEISVATDYGAQFGRDSYRARIPLNRARMAAIIAYLNALNAPFRAGERLYRWRIFNDNCVHVVHNALAAAGVWAPWPTGQHPALSAWNFPVPKNAFTELARRANDLPLDDAQALFEDAHARACLLTHGTLPTAPGGLASHHPALGRNDVYDIENLRLIFFDSIFCGAHRRQCNAIFAAPRYTDLHMNFRDFAARTAVARARPRARHIKGARALFQNRYEEHLARQTAWLGEHLPRLEAAP